MTFFANIFLYFRGGGLFLEGTDMNHSEELYELSEDQNLIRKKWWIDHKDYDWIKSFYTDETVFKTGNK